jgi:tetratricopeptide (TPR) repeat protein
MTIQEQFAQAFQLRKEKKYREALGLYEPLYANEPDRFGEWEGWSFASCYRGLAQHNTCLDYCRIFYKKFPEAPLIKQLYAWSVYYTQIANAENIPAYPTLKKAMEAIVKMSPPGTAYGCAERAIFKVIKHLGNQMQPNWPEINRLLGFLDSDKLSQETYTVDLGKGKKSELASDLEEWFSWKTKAMLQTEQWQACIDSCDRATLLIKKWHYSNNIWFARRKAAALSKLGETEAAKSILSNLITLKKEWFLLQDMAELENDATKALGLCTEAAVMYGDLDKKIRLFTKMAQLYRQTGEDTPAHEAGLLCLSIRHHNAWPIPADLETMVTETGGIPAKIEKPLHYLRPLENHWKKVLEILHPFFHGIIFRLFPDKQSGFIKIDDGGGQIYFSTRDWAGRPPALQTGMRLSFRKTKAWDKVKKQESEKAIHLQKEVKNNANEQA